MHSQRKHMAQAILDTLLIHSRDIAVAKQPMMLPSRLGQLLASCYVTFVARVAGLHNHLDTFHCGDACMSAVVARVSCPNKIAWVQLCSVICILLYDPGVWQCLSCACTPTHCLLDACAFSVSSCISLSTSYSWSDLLACPSSGWLWGL